jgi:hypothetical protein
VDYWAVDFDYMSRKEIIKVPVDMGVRSNVALPSLEPDRGELGMAAFEERWTGGYIFENEWQSFRTRQNGDLELSAAYLRNPSFIPAVTFAPRMFPIWVR